MISLLFTTVFVLLSSGAAPETQRAIRTPTGAFMVLRQGDKVFPTLEAWAAKEKISSATFTGFGFVNIKFGYFDFKKKVYTPKEFKSVELASFNGSIAWQKGKPSIHAHDTSEQVRTQI